MTFGALVDAWLKANSALAQSIPRGFLSVALARIAQRPLCSLYMPSDAPGFAGHCDTSLPKTCTDSDRSAPSTLRLFFFSICTCRSAPSLLITRVLYRELVDVCQASLGTGA